MDYLYLPVAAGATTDATPPSFLTLPFFIGVVSKTVSLFPCMLLPPYITKPFPNPTNQLPLHFPFSFPFDSPLSGCYPDMSPLL